MSKVHARRVPRLKDSEKERHAVKSKAFIRRYEKDGDDFSNRIITTDKPWLWFFNPETKSQADVWKRTSSPLQKRPESTSVEPSTCSSCFVIVRDAVMPRGATRHYRQRCLLLKAGAPT